MPPYNCHDFHMGGTDIDHSQMSEPIHRPAFAVLRQTDAFLPEELEDPCAEDEHSNSNAPHSSCESSVGSSSGSDAPCAKKHVSFTALHIRMHAIILGDHPCCTIGLPLTLDWTVESEVSVDLEQYEATRERRRSRTEMRLSLEDRRVLLSDISDSDVRRVQRKLHKDRRCTGRAKQLFFSSDEPIAELTPVDVGSSE